MAQSSQLYIDIGQGFSLAVGLPTIPTWETATRPEAPKRGMLGFNSQTKQLEFWDGAGWLVAKMSES